MRRGQKPPRLEQHMIMKNTAAALGFALAVAMSGGPAVATPISPANSIGTMQTLTEQVHYRGQRHCHRRNGMRRCHGGYSYYGSPGIYLGLGTGRRHYYRGSRQGRGHMMRGPGRMHHGGGRHR